MKEWLSSRFEISRGGTLSNLRSMEGLRGLAVFLVFLVHYVSMISPWLVVESNLYWISTMIHTIGNTGVDLFFVLSGYLIYGSLLAKPQKFGQFILRRVQRIYPAFLVVFFLYIILSFVFPDQNKIPESPGAASVYLLQNILLLPGIFKIEPLITVAWSLSYEMFYYLLIPLLFVGLQLRKKSTQWRTVFFILSAMGYLLYCATLGGPVRLVMFLSGIVLYEVITSFSAISCSSHVGLLAFLAGELVIVLPLTGRVGFTIKTAIMSIAFFVFCLASFRNPAGWLSRGLSWLPLRWLGNMSYSYYLMHGITLKACFMILARLIPVSTADNSMIYWLLPIMFALSLVPPAILFLTVEQPFSLSYNRSRKSGPAPSVIAT